MPDYEESQQSIDDQGGSQKTTEDQGQDQGTTQDQGQDQGTTQDQSQDQGTTDEQTQDQQTPQDQSQDQETTDEQTQDQQTPQDQSQDQGTTTDEQSQDQQTSQDQTQEQGTTDEQSQGQQTPQDQGQNRQTIGDQSGRQTTQPRAAGSKQSFVGQTTGATQTQGVGVQTQPQGRLGPGDHVWYYNGKISTDKNVPRTTWFPNSNPNDPNDYESHGGEIWHYVIHANGQIFAGQPHLRNHPGTFAWLNNNPGNITGVPGGANWGQYPNKFNWHNFLIFPSPEAGFDAIARFLRNASYPAKTRGTRQWPAGKYRDLSITEAFHRYAPEEDGNTPDKYGADVAVAAGVSQATLVGNLDDAQMLKMQTKIREIEGVVKGRELTRDYVDLPDAVRAALA
jgi:hypothetical protein